MVLERGPGQSRAGGDGLAPGSSRPLQAARDRLIGYAYGVLRSGPGTWNELGPGIPAQLQPRISVNPLIDSPSSKNGLYRFFVMLSNWANVPSINAALLYIVLIILSSRISFVA